jgi:hypothetical protein
MLKFRPRPGFGGATFCSFVALKNKKVEKTLSPSQTKSQMEISTVPEPVPVGTVCPVPVYKIVLDPNPAFQTIPDPNQTIEFVYHLKTRPRKVSKMTK